MGENNNKNKAHVQEPVFNSLKQFLEYDKPGLKKKMAEPWLYDFKFQHDQTLKSIDKNYVNNSFSLDDIESNMMRWRFYKCNFKIKGQYDCDGSHNDMQGYTNWLIRDIYRVLWAFDDIKKDDAYEESINAVSSSWIKEPEDILRLKSVNILRYGESIFKDRYLMGPETMNTVAITLAAYFGYKYLPFFNSDSIWNEFENKASNALELFFATTACLGNMVLVPAYFNPYRAVGSGMSDFWDLSLLLLKNKQASDDWKCTSYGNTHTIEWTSDDFTRYINCFFLWDYVSPAENGEGYCVKALFQSHEDKNKQTPGIASLKCESVMPKASSDHDDYEQFFEAANEKIIRRGKFMNEMLKIALIEDDIEKNSDWRVSKSYKKIMDEVFLRDDKIYESYDDVFKAIKDVLTSPSY